MHRKDLMRAWKQTWWIMMAEMTGQKMDMHMLNATRLISYCYLDMDLLG
jgi:hypothetical protein